MSETPNHHPAPTSDEVAGHIYRLAQANRMQRFAESNPADVGLDAISGPDGKIVPEAEDFRAVEQEFQRCTDRHHHGHRCQLVAGHASTHAALEAEQVRVRWDDGDSVNDNGCYAEDAELVGDRGARWAPGFPRVED